MNSRYILILVIIFLFGNLKAQDKDKNMGFFSSIQLSYVNNFEGLYYWGSTVYSFETEGAHVRSLNLLAGYYVISKKLSLGIGFGIDGFQNPNIATAPLYGDLCYFLSKKRNVPYLLIDYGGYLKLGSTFHNSGRYFRVGVGYKQFVSQKLCMTFDICYAPAKIIENSQNYYIIKGIAFNLGFVLF